MSKHPWPPRQLASIEAGLDQLASAVRAQGSRTDDEQIWLTRLLVVRACGYLEQVVHQCSQAHIEQRAGGMVRSFALSWTTKSRNPSSENLISLLGRFDANLQAEFVEMLEENDFELKRDLGSLLHLRHGIAHGLNEGLTTRRALELLSVAKYLADWFILVLNPDAPRAALKTGRAVVRAS